MMALEERDYIEWHFNIRYRAWWYFHVRWDRNDDYDACKIEPVIYWGA